MEVTVETAVAMREVRVTVRTAEATVMAVAGVGVRVKPAVMMVVVCISTRA